MKITRREVRFGEIAPWYYGLAYFNYQEDIAVYFVIPFNLIVRAMLNVWLIVRFIGGSDRITTAYNDGFKAGIAFAQKQNWTKSE